MVVSPVSVGFHLKFEIAPVSSLETILNHTFFELGTKWQSNFLQGFLWWQGLSTVITKGDLDQIIYFIQRIWRISSTIRQHFYTKVDVFCRFDTTPAKQEVNESWNPIDYPAYPGNKP